MKFTSRKRFNVTYWFCGVYKISKYRYFNGDKCSAHYQVYYLPANGKNWGNYVAPQHQHHKQLSYAACVKLADTHAKTYTPTKAQLNQANKAMLAWAPTV